MEIGTLIDRIPNTRRAAEDCRNGVDGASPEDIALEYEHLTLAQVHAALAYYHANREEIETDIAEEEAMASHWEGQLGSGLKRR